MHWRMLFWAFALAAASTAGRAEACFYSVANEVIGPKPTAEEIAADREALRRESLRQSTRAAQRRLASGADAASELAEMLVPNIQAVYIERGSCGVGEIDWAGSGEARYEPLAGTPYAGREEEFHPIVSDYGPGTLGPIAMPSSAAVSRNISGAGWPDRGWRKSSSSSPRAAGRTWSSA